jgi:hypothetical protein
MSGDMITYALAAFIIIAIGVGMMMLMSFSVHKRQLDVSWYQQQWQGIELQSEDGEAGKMLAIVNADKLLDKAMRDLAFKGDTMGARLKQHPQRFSDINGVWNAHKLRNRIAHDHNVHVSMEEVNRALNQLKTGLKNLGAL